MLGSLEPSIGRASALPTNAPRPAAATTAHGCRGGRDGGVWVGPVEEPPAGGGGMPTHAMRAAAPPLVLVLLAAAATGAIGGCSSGPPYPVTVSGLSSGGFFAVQAHVALSSLIKGAAVFAGGPYYCAMQNVVTAQTTCMKGPISELYVKGLEEATRLAASLGSIDPLHNLDDANVYVFSGSKDSVVHADVGRSLEQYYRALVGPSSSSSCGSITTDYDVPSEHCFPTVDTGHACGEFRAPYICDCGFDGAGRALAAVLGRGSGLKPRAPSREVSKADLYVFDQRPFVTDGLVEAFSLSTEGYAFVPPACDWRGGAGGGAGCPVHMVFHGCLQSAELVGDAMIMGAGYNEWALSNDIIVVYPQTTKVEELWVNPKSCWDWWGCVPPPWPARARRPTTAAACPCLRPLSSSDPTRARAQVHDIVQPRVRHARGAADPLRGEPRARVRQPVGGAAARGHLISSGGRARPPVSLGSRLVLYWCVRQVHISLDVSLTRSQLEKTGRGGVRSGSWPGEDAILARMPRRMLAVQ